MKKMIILLCSLAVVTGGVTYVVRIAPKKQKSVPIVIDTIIAPPAKPQTEFTFSN
jgi:hypothetical protein